MPPKIEDLLAAAIESDRATLLRKLLAVEFDLRKCQGETPCVDEYAV